MQSSCPSEILRCPSCKGPLAAPATDSVRCRREACGKEFPIVAGRPVLIDEARSVFSHEAYRAAGSRAAKPLRWRDKISFPSVNLSAVRSFATMRARLIERARTSGKQQIVLIVGGGVMGKGMQALHGEPSIHLVNVDPSPTSAAALFCDGHDLPFGDGTVDAVVVQAVLEHVADPQRCVAEIHRVLVAGGLVYSETPFMQQVHLEGYDFTRFTHIGHRRLFRWFSEIESGVVAGPATALAWSFRYFVSSFAPPKLSKAVSHVARVLALPLEQVDHFLRERPGALDAASCTYFLGARADVAASDRDVIDGYRGAL